MVPATLSAPRAGGRARGRRLLAAALLGSSAVAAPVPASSEVATDGTLGRRARFSARDVEVGAELGQRRGRNLFHSFERFGVDAGGSVTFTGPGGLDNVVSRVTGGEASRIDGTLRSRVPGADVWLVNPSGIVFGPGGRLDVPGSFHASTAGEVRFSDGARFSALDPDGSTLSVAPPEAFGFVGGGRPSAIVVDRGVLEVPAGEALSLVGGDVTITGGSDAGLAANAAGIVAAAGGRVTLGALGGPGELGLRAPTARPATPADIRVVDSAEVSASGDGAGSVAILGGRLVVDNQSGIFASNFGPTAPRGRLAVDADEVTVGAGSQLVALAQGSGDAGGLSIRTERLLATDGAVLSAETFGAGAGGDIDIGASDLLSVDNAFIGSNSRQGATGDGGTVTIEAGRVVFANGGRVFNGTNGPGDAGAVTVRAESVLINGQQRGGQTAFNTAISAAAQAGSTGDSAPVSVTARRIEVANGGIINGDARGSGDGSAVTLRGDEVVLRDGGRISSLAAGEGEGGTLSIRADRVVLTRRAVLSAETFGAGAAGAIDIDAPELLSVDAGSFIGSNSRQGATGDGGTVTIDAGRVVFADGGRVFNGTNGAGDGGPVTVRADMLLIDGRVISSALGFNTGISATAEPGSTGDAASVSVAARVIEITNGGVVNGDTRGDGSAGTVSVRADDLTIRDGGTISSFTSASSDAGTVDVVARNVRVLGGGTAFFTGITSQATPSSTGDAGLVRVVARDLAIRDSGEISTVAFGEGDAGEVRIEADRLLVSGDGSAFATGVFSSADPGTRGDAGSIKIAAGDLTVREGGSISSSAFGTGRAGDVVASSESLTVEDASIETQGTGAEGGRIDLRADDVAVLDGAEVTSNGIVPAAGASLITLRAPQIALLDSSRVTSLTGDGDPLTGSGEARVLGDATFISEDSEVRGSSAVELVGLDNTVGSGLQISPGAFLDAEGLMGQNCAARDAGRASTFTRAGRGGLPPAPDRPLTSAGPARSAGRGASAALLPGSLLLAGCDATES